MPFALHTVVDDPDLGIHVLERAVSALEPRFAELVPKGALTLKMRGTKLETAAHATKVGKRKAKERDANEVPREPIAVTLQGTFEIALAPTQSYWDRSHEIARLRALADRVVAAGKGDNATFTSSFGLIEARVQNPEAHRAALVEKWGARRRQLATEAKSADAILAAETCKPPGLVTEKVISLEEVELALPVECGPPDRASTPASTTTRPL